LNRHSTLGGSARGRVDAYVGDAVDARTNRGRGQSGNAVERHGVAAGYALIHVGRGSAVHEGGGIAPRGDGTDHLRATRSRGEAGNQREGGAVGDGGRCIRSRTDVGIRIVNQQKRFRRGLARGQRRTQQAA